MKRYISILLCFLWMGFIFYNSCKSGYESNYLSFSIAKDIKHSNTKETAAVKDTSKSKNPALTGTKQQQNLNLFLRKNAHAFEYLILAVFLALAFHFFGRALKDNIINILFLILVYAVSDEYHQLFVKGRSSLVTDIIIDFLGGTAGILLIYLVKSMAGFIKAANHKDA